jgi:tripartite-type tricarboxylate transporter receptor subunit TctC
MGTNALASVFCPRRGYDPQKDFEPIGLTAEDPELLVVRNDFPANNFSEFVAYAKPRLSRRRGHYASARASFPAAVTSSRSTKRITAGTL